MIVYVCDVLLRAQLCIIVGVVINCNNYDVTEEMIVSVCGTVMYYCGHGVRCDLINTVVYTANYCLINAVVLPYYIVAIFNIGVYI